MIRKIITIDREKCNGCGLCVTACHEGAIVMKDGKAELLRDDYCDGLGDCLPACPTGAISFEEREAPAYDEEAVQARLRAMGRKPLTGGCPGSAPKSFGGCPGSAPRALAAKNPFPGPFSVAGEAGATDSCLAQWPVQIKLVPVNAPYFAGADLLIAADCAAYAHGNFHRDFMGGKVTLIGCPKLDGGDYAEKLGEILRVNDVRSVTVARMSVPCCGGLESAVKRAIAASDKDIPLRVATISPQGSVQGLP